MLWDRGSDAGEMEKRPDMEIDNHVNCYLLYCDFLCSCWLPAKRNPEIAQVILAQMCCIDIAIYVDSHDL